MKELIYKKKSLLLENIFIITIGIHAYAKGIRDLAKVCNVAAGNVLLRSIFEGLVNIEYISLDDSQLRAIEFVLYDFKKQKKFVQDIIDSESFVGNNTLSSLENCEKKLEEINSEKEKYLSIIEKDYSIKIENCDQLKWEKFIWKRVPKDGLLSEYTSIYQYLCSFTHLDATGLKTFFHIGDKKYNIVIEKGNDEVESLLGATCAFYLKTLQEDLTKFNLYSEKELKSFEEVFKILNEKNQ